LVIIIIRLCQPAVSHDPLQTGSLVQVLQDHGGYQRTAGLRQFWCRREPENSLLCRNNIVKWVDAEDHHVEKNPACPDLLGDPEVSLAGQDLGTAEGLTTAVLSGGQSVVQLS